MLAGIWAITEPGNNLSIVQPLPSAAAAAPLPEPRRAPPPPTAPTPAPTPDPLAQKPEYDAALHEIEAGRADAGIAMLRNAADGGYVMAQYRLAKIYERGEGVPRNLTTAREWAERAARGGNRRAMHDVGVYFAQGEGAPHDEAAAFRWFREAAAFGVADSQYNLGLLYQQGRGVSVDAQEALFWFLVAAHHGEINAADRAVEIAAGMSASSVAQTRSRARAFQAREPDAAANG
jgi:localization factor PodJL